MSSPRYNLNNPAVKRILQEVKEMQSNPSDDYMSLPLEDNIFEWQFAIRGPRETEFEGGIYHGRIQLPPEYPFKPPAFMLLTPNGRFETQTKICLSISQYHPEHWQPSWSVRTALVALIAFMPTKGNGAIGSLEFTKEERKALALKSVEAPPKYGTAERQKVIDEIHAEMIRRTHKQPADPAPAPAPASTTPEVDAVEHLDTETPDKSGEGSYQNVTVDQNLAANHVSSRESIPAPESSNPVTSLTAPMSSMRPTRRQQAYDDQFLTLLAIGLVVALAALLMRKAFKSYWWINF